MKLFGILTILLAVVLTTMAQSTINKPEYDADAKLTKQQKSEYAKRIEQGLKHFDNKNYDLAEAEFKAILKFAPKKTLAYFNLGLTKYKQGDYPEAIKNFDQVIKLKSYYVGAAFYYKAISQLNLEQNEEATKTAKRFTNARFFYSPSQALIKTIQTGSDEFYENAKLAAADGNYELCLLEMDESVLTDTRKGRELVTMCNLALKGEESGPTAQTAAKNYYYNLFLDAHISQTDNVYQENSNKITKMTYFTEVGGEYVLRNKVDYGIGFSYDHYNAIDLGRFKDETYSVIVPLYYKADKKIFNAKAFYNLNKYQAADSYSDAGMAISYSYLESKYLLGFYGSSTKKTSLNTTFDYKAGTYNFARVIASRFINEFTVSALAGYEQNMSGDQPWGAFVLPYANKIMNYGLNVSYDLNKISKFSLRSNFANKDYTNKISTIFREDKTASYVLAYHHVFNKNVKAYLQQSLIKNTSSYEAAEFINRNYDENLTTLGISLITY